MKVKGICVINNWKSKMWKTFLTSRNERNKSVRHFRHLQNNGTTAALLSRFVIISCHMHRHTLFFDTASIPYEICRKKNNKRPYTIKLLKHETNVHNAQKCSSYLAENILHPHYRGRINTFYRFSENLSDVLSTYQSYSESKVLLTHSLPVI